MAATRSFWLIGESLATGRPSSRDRFIFESRMNAPMDWRLFALGTLFGCFAVCGQPLRSADRLLRLKLLSRARGINMLASVVTRSGIGRWTAADPPCPGSIAGPLDAFGHRLGVRTVSASSEQVRGTDDVSAIYVKVAEAGKAARKQQPARLRLLRRSRRKFSNGGKRSEISGS